MGRVGMGMVGIPNQDLSTSSSLEAFPAKVTLTVSFKEDALLC
jgi:hypothetical protein